MDENKQERLFEEMRDGYQKVTVGLDIGTTKIVAIIAAMEAPDRPLKILGVGTSVSDGLNRGVVVNINKTVRTIKDAIQKAEKQAGMIVRDVVCGIAGDHIKSITNSGVVTISNPNNEIKSDDVARVLLDAKNMAISSDRQILHILPQAYVIDGQDGISDPKGMCGVRLEAKCQIITGMRTAIQNIVQCVNKAGYKVRDIVLEPLASSLAVLSEDEKEVGVALIDIGGGTTDVAIFHDGIMKFTSVIGIAGKQVTNDISKILGVVSREAENIKRDYGCCFESAIRNDETFQIPGIGGVQPREIKRSELAVIMQDRMQEIFEMAGTEIINSGLAEYLRAGIVITGGTTLIEHSDLLASEIFGIPVRVGNPSSLHYEGLTQTVESPVFSTAMGLSLHSMYDHLLPEQKVSLENKVAGTYESSEEEPAKISSRLSGGFLGGKKKESTKDPDEKSLLGKMGDLLEKL
jgi:cell division protein FtsA